MKQQRKNWCVRVEEMYDDETREVGWQVVLCLPNYEANCWKIFDDRKTAQLVARYIRNAMKQIRQEVRR